MKEPAQTNAAGVDVMVDELAEMNAAGVDPAEEEAMDLTGWNVAGVDGDEQVCSVEPCTPLWGSDSLCPSVHPNRGSEVDIVVDKVTTLEANCNQILQNQDEIFI